MDGAESSSTIAAVSTTLADLSLVTRDAPPSTRQPVLPWDLLYLIAQFATEAGDSEWQRTEFEVAKLDEGAGGSGSRELKCVDSSLTLEWH